MRGLKECPIGCPITPSNLVVPLNIFTLAKASNISAARIVTRVGHFVLGLEKFIVVVSEEVFFAFGFEHVVEVTGLRGLQGGLYRLPARVGDRTRWKAAILIGVVRRFYPEIIERQLLLGLAQSVLDRGIYLQRHAGAYAVVDHGGYQRALLGASGLLLDEGRRGDELVLGEVETFLSRSEVQTLLLQEVLPEESIYYLRSVRIPLELVLLREEEAFGGLDSRVFEERIPIIGLFRRCLELLGGYVALLGDRLRGLAQRQAFGDRDSKGR